MHSTGNRFVGKEAVTHYRVLRRFPQLTSLETALETGRKNQIRVHLAELGHPIVGDQAYGSRMNPMGRRSSLRSSASFAYPPRSSRRFGNPANLVLPTQASTAAISARDEEGGHGRPSKMQRTVGVHESALHPEYGRARLFLMLCHGRISRVYRPSPWISRRQSSKNCQSFAFWHCQARAGSWAPRRCGR